MFAQANSEHCRHKIFNADFRRRRRAAALPLRDDPLHRGGRRRGHRHRLQGQRLGDGRAAGRRWLPEGRRPALRRGRDGARAHEGRDAQPPTAISPFPGAATGAGGEIRDEGATGRGSQPKAGLTGFAVSNLHLPGLDEPWEREPYGAPGHIASPLEIMIEGPIGGAAFNNEFGRPGWAASSGSTSRPSTGSIAATTSRS